MDKEGLSVNISGAVYALLLYEHARSAATVGDQYGFLCGDIIDYETKTITDTEREVRHRKRYINITSLLAYPPVKPFFNSNGDIDVPLLKRFLKDKEKYVVGWFHYRNYELPSIGTNSLHAQKLTFRDNHLFRNLKNYFSKINTILIHTFLMMNNSSSVSPDEGTHTFKQQAIIQTERSLMKPIPICINNLGMDTSKVEGLDYKLQPHKHMGSKDTLDNLYGALKDSENFKDMSDLATIRKMQNESDKLMKKMIPKISKKEKRISELEFKIKDIREKIFDIKFTRDSKKEEERQKLEKEEKEEQINKRLLEATEKYLKARDEKLKNLAAQEERSSPELFEVMEEDDLKSSGAKSNLHSTGQIDSDIIDVDMESRCIDRDSPELIYESSQRAKTILPYVGAIKDNNPRNTGSSNQSTSKKSS